MVKIITDSTCDLLPDEQKALSLTVVPLTVNFEDGAYLDGTEMTHELFYQKLAVCTKLPTTSQPSPEAFESCFTDAISDGSDVVALFLSSKFSGTYQNAYAAAREVAPQKIFCIDTPSSSFGTSLIIRMACKFRDLGDSAQVIYDKCLALCKRLRLFATITTLKYLRMGGRLSDTAALIGGALNLRLVAEVRDGKISLQGIVRGDKSCLKAIMSHVQKEMPDFSLPVCFGHSNAPDAMQRLREYFGAFVPEGTEVVTGNLGSVIGTHVGPGMIAFSYFAAE